MARNPERYRLRGDFSRTLHVMKGGFKLTLRQNRAALVGLAVGAAVLCAPVASAQIGKLIKLLGVWEVTKRFGGEIDREFNKLIKRDPKAPVSTKVVPIITGGIGSRNAVGMVQISGPKAQVDKVKSVAQLEQGLFGKEIQIRAMIPIESENMTSDMDPVEQVGVTGIVDFKL